MADIIKIDSTILSHIKSEKLRAYTDMLAKELQNMHVYMLRASVVLVAIDESKCYEEDGFESIHDYTNQVLGIKKAQSYAILNVGRNYVDTASMQSVLPHNEGNDYTMTQLQALLPLKSVDTAMQLANDNIINPDMTVKQLKEVVSEYKPTRKKEGDTNSVDEGSEEESEVNTKEPEPVKMYKIEHTIKIGHYETGEPIAIVDGNIVEYDTAYELVATGKRSNN